MPDQWTSWAIPAILRGLSLARKKKPSAIWSTFPIPTALIVGYYVSKLTGIPWVVDIRDVILDDEFPEVPVQRWIYGKLERRVVNHASAIVVATDNAASIYVDRFPQLRNKVHVIRNGFDEEVIAAVEESVERDKAPIIEKEKSIRLVHSGLLSPVDRNPIPFFDALIRLRENQTIDIDRLKIDFRASGNDDRYAEEIERRGLTEFVRLLPPVSYRDALKEMITADGLLLFQGRTCNHAVPAKVYEYLRCGPPIFVAADPTGETATMLSGLGCEFIADIDSVSHLAEQFARYVCAVDRGNAFAPPVSSIIRFSRQQQARDLEYLLHQVTR
jgi:glycosyltransferase involved in cell wall biosynthesis